MENRQPDVSRLHSVLATLDRRRRSIVAVQQARNELVDAYSLVSNDLVKVVTRAGERSAS